MIVHRVTPLPVLFACQGCAEFGDSAAEFARREEASGGAEAALLGARAVDEGQLVSKARSRFPIIAVDGCVKACARHWLEAHGACVQRHFILTAS